MFLFYYPWKTPKFNKRSSLPRAGIVNSIIPLQKYKTHTIEITIAMSGGREAQTKANE